MLRGGGGGRAFIQGVEEERSESVEYRSLESVISCGVQSVCVASGTCVRSVKRFLNGRCTTYYIGSGPERMFMLLRVLTRFKTVITDNAARVSSMVSSCTPETGGLASHWTLPESGTKFAFGFGPPDAHPLRRASSDGPKVFAGFVPEIESRRRDCETPSRSRQSPEHSAQRVDSVCNTSTTSSTCPELPASST